MAYWDPAEILTDGQKLQCTFRMDVPGLGYLQSDEQKNIKANSRVDLPFWMAEFLALHGKLILHVPKPYAVRVRSALDANPRSVNLRNLHPSWYAFASRMGPLMDDSELVDAISKTYSARLPQVYEQAQSLSSLAGATGSAESGGPSSGVSRLDALGGSGVARESALSAEMVEFLSGLDESERRLLRSGQMGATVMRNYLAGNR
ncbi:DNA replication protein [Tilletia horrida]|uniref:DNA replication complex GINS protein PSF3 n=1 Tax=Tilletia horrida TaxID=155126 RepID=A0AAN6GH29_9BASI|nr:DNA replication protein [Tilletia horrida]KAK0540101.1 DNA replication protein [Tilletia horrida]KAK0541535.1 DNA replication protein [Tilletia horrida]